MEQLTVIAVDQFNNIAISYTGTVAFTSSDQGASTVLPGPSTLTAGMGVFSVQLTTAGTQVITGTDTQTSSITGVSNPIVITAAPATHFTLGVPGAVTAGAGFNFTVTAQDQFGNTDTGYLGTVGFFTTDPGAVTLPAPSTFSAGVGSFSATLATAGNQNLTATDQSVSSITGISNTINVSAAAATHYAVSAPGSVSRGIGFTVTVTAEDQFNNTATSYTGTVGFSSSDGPATLPAPSTLSAGIGSFSATLGTLGSQTLTATDTQTPSITGSSATIVVNRPPATHFAFSVSSASTTAGIVFSFTVTAEDQFNNTVINFTSTVNFSSSDSAATLPASSTLTNGVGTFSATLVTAGNQTVTVTDPDPFSSSLSITITPAAAQSLLVTAPQYVIAGRAFPFVVTAQDQFGNTDTNYTGTVGFSSSDSATGAAVPGNTTLTAGVGTLSATLVSVGTQSLTATDIHTPSITGSATITVPVSIYIPNATTGRNGVVTVPIDVNNLIDPNSILNQSGLSGGTFVLYFDPSVFTVSATDVQLGTIKTPSVGDPSGTAPGDGYAPNPTNIQDGPNNGWQVGTLPTSGPGADHHHLDQQWLPQQRRHRAADRDRRRFARDGEFPRS